MKGADVDAQGAGGERKAALLVVEPGFLVEHVGVRRVIFYYWEALAAAGYRVTLAMPRDGVLDACGPLALPALRQALRDVGHDDGPCWTSADPVHRPAPERAAPLVALAMVRWDAGAVRPEDFDVSIVTNPWLCARGLPEADYTAGIIHDLVPNWLACGALSFGAEVEVYRFAREHDVGARFFSAHMRHILCVSHSTRSDFLSFYGPTHRARVGVLVPFAPDDAAVAGDESAGDRKRILLVNVLDPRKNFAAAATALKLAARSMPFDVRIVGHQRMPLHLVLQFLEDLRAAGLDVAWYAGVSDECLSTLYQGADVLLFPSFYEGLGLPMLEAQARGVPAISSNTSSCIEINLNPALCVDPHDGPALAGCIVDTLRRPDSFDRGERLRARLADRLAGSNGLLAILNGPSGADAELHERCPR